MGNPLYKANYSQFFAKIEYQFQDLSLFHEAITHPSVNISHAAKLLSNEDRILGKVVKKHNQGLPFNYERLEFLGDRVLGFVLGKVLFSHFAGDSEGLISRRFSNIACGRVCAEIAISISLGDEIVMSVGEEKYNGKTNSSILENALEALIGAIFLDGGIDAAQKFILKYWHDYIYNLKNKKSDAKSRLQEWSQGVFQELPIYKVEGINGPDHAPIFLVSVTILQKNLTACAESGSKKEAERLAAQKMIELLKI